MPVTNDFKPFATNQPILDFTPWNYKDLPDRAEGLTAGLFNPDKLEDVGRRNMALTNTALRQATSIAAAMASLAETAGEDMVDNGDVLALASGLAEGIRSVIPLATDTDPGLVMGSSADDGVSVDTSGEMTVPGLAGKEDVSNKVTTIRDAATADDDSYPTEKAVRDTLNDLSQVNSLLTMGPPDMTKGETKVQTAAETQTSATWTADRDGYVVVGSTDSGSDIVILIAGEEVGRIKAQHYFSAPLPIRTGQVVLIRDYNLVANSLNYVKIRFYPPVINPPVYVPGQPLLNYSTVEQDTGIKDIDGRAIYQKTVTGNIVAAINTDTYTQLVSGVLNLIKTEGWIQTGDDANIKPLPLTLPGYAVAFTYQHGGDVFISSNCNTARAGTTNNAYRVTIRYTKL